MYIENIVIDAIRIISVLNAYYRRITKIMRIACVLKARFGAKGYNSGDYQAAIPSGY